MNSTSFFLLRRIIGSPISGLRKKQSTKLQPKPILRFLPSRATNKLRRIPKKL